MLSMITPCTPWAGGFTARRSWSSHPSPTSAYALRGVIAGRRRPLCARGHRVPVPLKSTDGYGRRGQERLADRPARLLVSDLAFQDDCSLS